MTKGTNFMSNDSYNCPQYNMLTCPAVLYMLRMTSYVSLKLKVRHGQRERDYPSQSILFRAFWFLPKTTSLKSPTGNAKGKSIDSSIWATKMYHIGMQSTKLHAPAALQREVSLIFCRKTRKHSANPSSDHIPLPPWLLMPLVRGQW